MELLSYISCKVNIYTDVANVTRKINIKEYLDIFTILTGELNKQLNYIPSEVKVYRDDVIRKQENYFKEYLSIIEILTANKWRY